ncbi:MAG: hypothetical protein GWP14_09050 [Actinobacteria bacterium]|nr:hypothetical protein [Actinomycetota bacterium]
MTKLTEESKTLLNYIDEVVNARVTEKFGRLESQIDQALKSCGRPLSNRATIVVFSGDMDKMLAAFVISTGAAAMGMDVSMYFTFWGLAALKKKRVLKGKPITEKLMGLMLPAGPDNLASSKMNMLGIGPAFFRYLMKKKNIETLPDLIALASEMHVRLVACQMSMEMMGITRGELIDGLEYGGVATYLADAADSRITLFI